MRHATFRAVYARILGATCLIAAIVVLTPGCSKSTSGHVFGTVYAPDGKPLPGGTVVFYATEGKTLPASAEIKEGGTYDMPKAPAGKVRISVTNLYLKEGIPPPVGAGGGPTGSKMPAAMQGKVKGPPAGVNMGPPKSVDTSKAPGGGAPKGDGKAPEKYVPIPEKYANQDTSGLEYEVKPGKQQHDIKLTK